MRFSDQVAIVSGSARGIGRAIAERLASEGARVVVNDILSDELLAATAQACRDKGGEALAVRGDITEPATAEQLVTAATKRLGGLDVVVNNAFWAHATDFLAEPVADWSKTLDVSLTGAMRLCKAALPFFVEHRAGSIVNVSSIHALAAGRRYAAYEAAKSGLIGLTRAIAADFGRQGVRCNAVCPGLVVTERNAGWWPEERLKRVATAYPLGRIGSVEDVAAAVAFLASSEAAFITGACLPVDGGLTALLPEVPALQLYDQAQARERRGDPTRSVSEPAT